MYAYGGLVNKEIGFHATKNFTGLSALGSVLKDFWGTGLDGCEGRILGQWTTQWVNTYIPI